MSSAALARKRRANMSTSNDGANVNPNGMVPEPPTTQPKTSMTIPQVLSVFEKRIMDIEKRIENQSLDKQEKVVEKSDSEMSEHMKQVIDEYEERFEMLLTQINQMKEMLSSLQMYTMEVNKILLERSGILTQEEVNQITPPSPVEMKDASIATNLHSIPVVIDQLENKNISSIPEERDEDLTDLG